MARSDVSLLNFVVSDGRTLIATRYVSNADEAPASLYYAEVGGVGGGWEGGLEKRTRACARAAVASCTARGSDHN